MFKKESIRNFYFENEKGQQIDCQKIDGNLFFYNVAGLGHDENIEYERVGNTFIQNKKEIKQNQITGDLEFYEMTYDEYSIFVDFILNSKKLRLIYLPPKTNRVKYYRDIDLVSISKGEEDDNNILTSSIIITCKSLWYEENKTVYRIQSEKDEIKWDFRWNSKFANYDTRKLKIINKGHTEAPILVEMQGHIKKPCISLYIDGQLYQEVKINIEIAEYEKLLYGTKENDFYINKQNTDGTIESLFSLDYIDFYNDNVIRLPQNRSCELRLTADNEILNATIIVPVFYKTV